MAFPTRDVIVPKVVLETWEECVDRQCEEISSNLEILQHFAVFIPRGWRTATWWEDVVFWLSSRWTVDHMKGTSHDTFTPAWAALGCDDPIQAREKIEEMKKSSPGLADAFAFAYAVELRRQPSGGKQLNDYEPHIDALELFYYMPEQGLLDKDSSIEFVEEAITSCYEWFYWDHADYRDRSFDWVEQEKPGWTAEQRIGAKEAKHFGDDSLFPIKHLPPATPNWAGTKASTGNSDGRFDTTQIMKVSDMTEEGEHEGTEIHDAFSQGKRKAPNSHDGSVDSHATKRQKGKKVSSQNSDSVDATNTEQSHESITITRDDWEKLQDRVAALEADKETPASRADSNLDDLNSFRSALRMMLSMVEHRVAS